MKFDKYISPMNDKALMEACAKIKHVALDMDGTIYLGDTLFPFTKQFLSELCEMGIAYSFLTNNPTRSCQDYLEKLYRLGIYASGEQVYTSSIATIDYIHQNYPDVHRIFILGTESMQDEFRKSGFEISEDSERDLPNMLVVGFDPTLTYSRLCRAAWWASKANIPYIATNPDWVCPTDLSTILVDCGSLCKAIEGATKRKPDVVIGKPNPNMLYCIRDKYGLQSDEIAMCGDRIYTDVATAQNAGSMSVLVLSGETTLEQSLTCKQQPDLTISNIAEFGKLLIASRNRQ